MTLPAGWLSAVESALRVRPGTRDAGNGELVIRCLEPERHRNGDAHPSASWNVGKGTGGCHACSAAWSTLQAAGLLGLALPQAARPNVPLNGGAAERSWQIRDRAGNLIATHHRRDLPDGSKRLWWTAAGGSPKLDRLASSLPLYGAHLISTFDHGRPVIITEGEPATDALVAVGIQAVATATGAASCPSSEVLADLSGFAAVLWPDRDSQGEAHMKRVGARLLGVAASVAVLPQPPNAQPKDDAADFVQRARERGLSAEQIRQRVERAVRRLAVPVESPERQGGAAGEGSGPRAVAVPLSTVEPEAVRFLWPPYLPLGKLAIFEGAPGDGKTFLALAIAAAVSRGWALPGDDAPRRAGREPGSVLYLSAEDGLADTLRPRLDAMGADCARIVALTGWREGTAEGPLTLADLPIIEAEVERWRPVLVVLDPIQAYLGAGVDSHRANEVRPLLAALGRLAERHGCAVVVIRHLRKSGADRAVYRGLDSIDFSAASRSILLVADPEPERPGNTLRVVAHVKSSCAPRGASLQFDLCGGRFAWAGESDLTADELLAVRRPEPASKLGEAELYLQAALADGPRLATELYEGAPCSERTLKEAKSRLGVRARKAGFSEGWEWELALPKGAKGAEKLHLHPSAPPAGENPTGKGTSAKGAKGASGNALPPSANEVQQPAVKAVRFTQHGPEVAEPDDLVFDVEGAGEDAEEVVI